MHLFTASSPPLFSFYLHSEFQSLSPCSLSPPMNCEVHSRANLLFLFDKRPPLALAIKVNERRHKDPAHAINGHIVTCSTRTHTHTHTYNQTEVLRVSGFTSLNGFLSTGYLPIETRTTSVTLSLLNTRTS